MKKYKKSKWSGLDRFECKQCKFDSLSEDVMSEHIKAVHEPKPRKSKILDSKGEQIKIE